MLTAAFIALAYNINIAGFKPIDRSTVVTNMLIGLVGETIVADGFLCVIAARQQRRAHTFLATWQAPISLLSSRGLPRCPSPAARKRAPDVLCHVVRQMRPRGCLLVYIAVTLAAFCPIWYTVLITQTVKRDESHVLGYHSWPSVLYTVNLHRERYNNSKFGVYTTLDCGEGYTGSIDCNLNDIMNLRVHCGAPPGELSNAAWCEENSYPTKCCAEMLICPPSEL